jgi:hypothetical protein
MLESVCIDPPFLTSELDGGEWSALRSGYSPPRTHWVGGWVGPRAGLVAVEKRKILPLQGIEARPSDQ